jgi:hypothetical protein
MASDYETVDFDESNFSFAVRELRQAKIVQALTLELAPEKPSCKEQGADPYNTSGSFDRTKNWTRVRKR